MNIQYFTNGNTHHSQFTKLLLDFAHLTHCVGKGSSQISFKGEHGKTMNKYILYIYAFSFGNTEKEIIFFLDWTNTLRCNSCLVYLHKYHKQICSVLKKLPGVEIASFDEKLYFHFFVIFIFQR